MFRNKFMFYGELLAPRPTPKLEDHQLSSVRGCLFNVFAANLHYWRPSLYPRPEEAPFCGDKDPPKKDTGNSIHVRMEFSLHSQVFRNKTNTLTTVR
jgi:hypothetical protein